MTARQVLRLIKRRADERGLEVDLEWGKGSHRKVTVGDCQTTVPVHAREDIGRGLLRQIERDLEPALGERWMR